MKEGTEDGDAEVVGGKTPVEDGLGGARFRGAPPKHPCGEDAIKERLDESRQEKVFALLTFKGNPEGFLESGLNTIECSERMRGGAGAGLASVGGEQPRDVLWLFQRDLASHDSQQEVRKRFGVLGDEIPEWEVPE